MKCQFCHIENNLGTKYCKQCGKRLGENANMKLPNINHLSMNTTASNVSAVQPTKGGVLNIKNIVIAAIFLMVILIAIGWGMKKNKFSIIGTWKVIEVLGRTEGFVDVEFHFLENGEVKARVNGIVEANLRWQKEGEDEQRFYISGRVPYLSADVGTIAFYDKESKLLTFDLAGQTVKLKRK